MGRRAHTSTTSAYHILGKPHPAVEIDIDTNPYVMERSAGQVDAVPACGRLIYHALLYRIDTGPGSRVWSCTTDVLTAIREVLKTLVGDANALIQSIGTGVAEAAMNHVPAMQSCASGKRVVPDKWIEASNSPVMVN